MMTEMNDPMVWESVLAARAWEKQDAVSKTGVFENSIVDSPASGAMEVTEQAVGMETAGEGAAVAQKKRKNRGKNWAQKDTDDLLRAVLNTNKVRTRMEQGTDGDSYWVDISKAVPGRTGHECQGRMDTLKRSFSTTKKYCDEQLKEFKQLSEKDFLEMKVSPRLTEAWYHQIRDYCPPRSKKKLKTNGAGSSSKSTGFVPETSTLAGLLPPVLGEPSSVASGPVTLPMGDPPACLEFLVADLQQQAPPVPQSADVAEDFIEDLFPDLLQQQAPPVPPSADVAEDFMEDLFPSFELGPYPWM